MFRLHVSLVDAVAFEGGIAIGALEGDALRSSSSVDIDIGVNIDIGVKRRMSVQSAQLRETSVTHGANVWLLIALKIIAFHDQVSANKLYNLK